MNLARLLDTNRFAYQLLFNKKNVIEDRNLYNRQQDLILQPRVGEYKLSTRVDDYDGWMRCDGRLLSRVTFAELFAAIGTSFGSGDGSTTFNLPDCRGRVTGAIGQGSGLTNRSMGDNPGAETHTLNINEMPSHNHSITDPQHSHGSVPNGTQEMRSVKDGIAADTHTAADEPRTADTALASTGISINNTGGSQPHNNMQPTIFLGNVFIYSGQYTDRYVLLDVAREWAAETNQLYTDAFDDAFNYVYDNHDGADTGYSLGTITNIQQGGANTNGNIFDNGNYIWIDSNKLNSVLIPKVVVGSSTAIPYGILHELPNHKAGFYISNINIYPNVVVTYGVDAGTTMKIRTFGNVGTDAATTIIKYNGLYACNDNNNDNRNGSYWAVINTRSTADNTPNLAEVWFTVLKPEWNSSISAVDDQRRAAGTNVTDNYDHYVEVTGSKYLFCKVLLARSQKLVNGVYVDNPITQEHIEKFLKAYVMSMPSYMGFITQPSFQY